VSNQEIIIALYTIVRREIRRFTRIWAQTLLPPAITMSLYFIIFGTLIGSRIGEMGGFSYMEFIVPGLIMMSVITNSYSNVVSSFYSAKFQRNVEEMLVSPMPNWVILVGYIMGGMARGIIVGFIVTMLSLFFTDLQVHNLGIVIGVTLLTSILFATGGFINAMLANSFDDVSIVPTFILTPLTYLGGVFYSISLLSDFWQGVSQLNPILYMVSTFRYGILGSSDINIYLSIGVILFFVVSLFCIALNMLSKGKGIRS
jgi:ABC-2 type transport system permease protein